MKLNLVNSLIRRVNIWVNTHERYLIKHQSKYTASCVELGIIKRPSRDTCLYMGEATPLDSADPQNPDFLFAKASQP